MAKVLLVSFPGYPYTPSSLLPDNGLASLAGALSAAGHEAKALDYGTVQSIERLFPRRLSQRVRPLAERLFIEGGKLNWAQKLKFLAAGKALERHQAQEADRIAQEVAREAEAWRADVVGLKLWNGDGFAGPVKIAQAVRERLPDVAILGGGPQVDYFGEHIFGHTRVFDALLRGEGERALPAMVDAITEKKEWRHIPGLIRLEGGRAVETPPQALPNLDDLPWPEYGADVYPAMEGDQKIRMCVIDESRGCPNRCAFCIHPSKSGGYWALKPPERVLDEMRRAMQALRSRYFVYSGSNTSAKVALGIAQKLIETGLDVRYACFGHVRGIEKADFDLLARSGCEAIFYGLESGSPRILKDAFDKRLDLDTAERVIRQTKEAGICAIASLIYPAPFEDAESRRETLDLLKRLRPDSVPVTIPGVIPGTPWAKEPEKYGFKMLERKDLWEYALTYKIKLLYPPSMWKPMPYTLHGKSSKEFFKECEAFIADIEAAGLLTNVPHEMALMASALGQGDDLGGFRDRSRTWFFSGDVDSIASMVEAINRNVAPQEAAAQQE